MMIERIFVRPINNLIVRDPVTLLQLPAEGKSVPLNTYWARRLKDHSVEQVEEIKQIKKSLTIKNKKGNK